MIFFESRGKHKIMSEMTRLDYLELVIKSSISEFISNYIYNGYHKGVVLSQNAIDKFEIEEQEKELGKHVVRDLLVESLMIYQRHLITIIRSINNKDVTEKIKCLQKSLERNSESLDYYYLIFENLDHFDLLHGYFRKDVIERIDSEIREHLEDIKDVELGREIKTISQKERELNEEHELFNETSRINSSYWTNYEDQIRAVRELDDDCRVF